MFRILLMLAMGWSGLAAASFEHECGSEFRAFAPVDSPEYRKYPPSREVDVLHLSLDVTPNFKERSVQGVAALKFIPLTETLSTLTLHAVDLRVEQITSTSDIAHFENTGKELVIHFSRPLPRAETQVTVKYRAFPQKGLYFRTADMGYLPEDEHLFTQGEDIEARHWFPCYDHPSEKFTSEITCRVPQEMTVLSNGKLLSETSLDNGMKAVRWLQDKPHVSYLISLVAGKLKKLEDQYKDIHLAFYTPTSQIDLAQNSFAETKEMMAFFEEEIGVPYPWDKYYQVCVQDFMWGGMENTSVTTLADRTLFPEETENVRSSEGLVAHELAHQWFGDLVTCEDWSHIWLNEGFATYYAHLYNLHQDGRDEFLYGLYQSARRFIDRTVAEDSRPVVFRKYDRPVELFGYLVYPKGAWVLHMLRSQLGPELYRQCIKTYLERNAYGTVNTYELIAVIEELTGKSWAQFFDQWIFHPHHPELKISYSWNAAASMAKLEVSQVQPLTNEVALFHFPLKVRVRTKTGTRDQTFAISRKQEVFYLPCDSAPEIVRIDPEYELLAKISFEPPRAMLLAQLADKTDVIGRILALQQLKKSTDPETVGLIANVLNNDPFHGVRIEAAQALREIHSAEALQQLTKAVDQKDARVRLQVAMALGRFYDPLARKAAAELVQQEKNPDIAAASLKALGPYPVEELRTLLEQNLKSSSFRNLRADGGVAAIREQRDPSYIEPLTVAIQEHGKKFTAQGLTNALEALALLARETDQQTAAFNLIASYANHPRETIQVGAILALGILGDERGLSILSNLASGPADSRVTEAAARSSEILRSRRAVFPELKTLRTELLELKKRNEELQRTVGDLKKKVEAKPLEPGKKRNSRPPKLGGR